LFIVSFRTKQQQKNDRYYFRLDRVYSYRILNKKLNIKNGMEPYLITDSSSPIEEDIIPNKDSDFDSNSLERRASESAEKYFDWASKTNRKFHLQSNSFPRELTLYLCRSNGIFSW